MKPLNKFYQNTTRKCCNIENRLLRLCCRRNTTKNPAKKNKLIRTDTFLSENLPGNITVLSNNPKNSNPKKMKAIHISSTNFLSGFHLYRTVRPNSKYPHSNVYTEINSNINAAERCNPDGDVKAFIAA